MMSNKAAVAAVLAVAALMLTGCIEDDMIDRGHGFGECQVSNCLNP